MVGVPKRTARERRFSLLREDLIARKTTAENDAELVELRIQMNEARGKLRVLAETICFLHET